MIARDLPDRHLPFGAYAPRGLAKLLIGASRNTPLGRGEPRKLAWRLLRAGSQPCFDVLVRSVRMRLFPFDNSLEQTLLLRPLKYCPGELAFLGEALAAGGTLVDAGANVGAMSLPFAGLRGVRIIAVEPEPEMLARLRFNVAANAFASISIDAVALSDAEGTTPFVTHARDAKLSGIGNAAAKGSAIEVRTKTFAALLQDHAVRAPYVLKIDIERHEDAVLMPFFRSTAQSLWPRHVLIETIERDGMPDCLSFMLTNGYRMSFRTRQNTGLTLLHAA